jgi:hypothetical protein
MLGRFKAIAPVVLIAAPLFLAGGCATQADEGTRSAATAAQSDAAEARRMAQEAMRTAQAAQQEAREAKGMAEAAMSEARAASEKADRMFQRSLRK